MDGRMERNIGKAFGFLKSRVFDFELEDDRLWVSHSGGVQAIDLSFSALRQAPPQLRLVQVTVSDTMLLRWRRFCIRRTQDQI